MSGSAAVTVVEPKNLPNFPPVGGVSEGKAVAEAEELYGGSQGLGNKYDLVMFCQPPGTGTWLAYAYVNSIYSFYNDIWCSSSSAQMHEVGHSLNLAHSGHDGNAYGDQSGYMGYSYVNDEIGRAHV